LKRMGCIGIVLELLRPVYIKVGNLLQTVRN